MKRLVTIQDFSCVGRCSLTVALPIISACGVECAALPTALLSNHTAFPDFTFCDLTNEYSPIVDMWSKLSLDFDAVYTGYLGSKNLVKQTVSFIASQVVRNTKIFIDPAMGDYGKLYTGFDQEYADMTCEMCRGSYMILPNITEACFMLHEEYKESYEEAYIKHLLARLSELGVKKSVLTGVGFAKDEIGFYMYDAEEKSFSHYYGSKLPFAYHGTGDIFSSVAVGAVLRGKSDFEALKMATDFTYLSMKYTREDEARRDYGVNFEEALPYLIENLK